MPAEEVPAWEQVQVQVQVGVPVAAEPERAREQEPASSDAEQVPEQEWWVAGAPVPARAAVSAWLTVRDREAAMPSTVEA